MIKKQYFPLGTLVLLILLIALTVVISLFLSPTSKEIPQNLIKVLRPAAAPIRPFTLTDHNGKLFTEKHLKSKWSLFFFGYSYCPDICPTTLTALKVAIKKIKDNEQAASSLQILFVSLDPDRDTSEVMASYIRHYGDKFVGLTGFRSELDALTKQFNVMHQKENAINPGNYLITHSGTVFVSDPQGRIVASFPPPHDPEVVAKQYLQLFELF